MQVPVKWFKTLEIPAEPAEANAIYFVREDEDGPVEVFVTDDNGMLTNPGNTQFIADAITASLANILENTALTGEPTAPTAEPGTDTEQIATCEFVISAINALINASPGALDTLNELAAALGDDPNFATTMTAALAGKQGLSAELTAIAALATTPYGRALLTLANQAALQAEIGLEVGSDVQAYSANLTTFAGIAPSANIQSILAAANYAAVRTLLGLVIGATVQGYSANLDGWSGVTPSANGLSIITAADYSAMRTLLGLVIGTNVQAQSANLNTWSALAPSANGQSLVTAANYATMLTLLGAQAALGFTPENVANKSTNLTADGASETKYPNCKSAKDYIDANIGGGYPPGHIFGLTMSNAADANNDITVAAGKCRDEADTANMVLAAPITKRLDAAWAVGDNQGGLNTGAEANSTWYEVMLIKRSDTGVVDVMFTTAANRTTLPADYDSYRHIGWIRNDGSGNILQFTQRDDYITLVTQINDVATNLTSSAAAVTLTVPPNCIARFRASMVAGAGGNNLGDQTVVFTEIAEGNVTPTNTTGIASLSGMEVSAGVVSPAAGWFELQVDANSQIEHDSSANGATGGGTFDISTFGWIDHRRRLSNS